MNSMAWNLLRGATGRYPSTVPSHHTSGKMSLAAMVSNEERALQDSFKTAIEHDIRTKRSLMKSKVNFVVSPSSSPISPHRPRSDGTEECVWWN